MDVSMKNATTRGISVIYSIATDHSGILGRGHLEFGDSNLLYSNFARVLHINYKLFVFIIKFERKYISSSTRYLNKKILFFGF